jgi:hypothetical protein
MLVTLVSKTVPGIFAHAVQRQHSCPRNKRLAAAQAHAALAGHHVLGDIETVAAEVAEGAGVLAVGLRFNGVRSVLDHDRDCACVRWP